MKTEMLTHPMQFKKAVHKANKQTKANQSKQHQLTSSSEALDCKQIKQGSEVSMQLVPKL